MSRETKIDFKTVQRSGQRHAILRGKKTLHFGHLKFAPVGYVFWTDAATIGKKQWFQSADDIDAEFVFEVRSNDFIQVDVKVKVTSNFQFRATIGKRGEPAYEVTINGLEWQKGKGREFEPIIRKKMKGIITSLEKEATTNFSTTKVIVTSPEILSNQCMDFQKDKEYEVVRTWNKGTEYREQVYIVKDDSGQAFELHEDEIKVVTN